MVRETARLQLAGDSSKEGFEAWWRAERPEDGEFVTEIVGVSEWVARADYACAPEEHAHRALRLFRVLRSARPDPDKTVDTAALLLRLAERAVIEARDRWTEEEARRLREELRS